MKILLAEDDLVLRCLLEELLGRWGHETLVADEGNAALALAGASFDVAILDWMMPGASGPEVCRAIREAHVERRPYVLMLTAKQQVEDVVAGLDAGADEYLTKPYRPAELAARLRAAQRLIAMQDDLIAARKLVAYQARHDLASGALNRATWMGELHDVVHAQRAWPSPVSLVRIGIGGARDARRVRIDDAIVKAVFERVSGPLAGGALVGRTGDAELLVALPGAGEDEATVTANVLGAAVRSAPIPSEVGPVLVSVDVCSVTAATVAELDLGWLLCAIDAVAVETRSDARGPDLAIAS